MSVLYILSEWLFICEKALQVQITFDQMKYRQEVGGRSLTKVGELPISTALLLLLFLVLPT